MNYIIDGYNLAFKIKSIHNQILGGNTGKAIVLLIQFVKQQLHSKAEKIILALDGEKSSANKSNLSGIELWFSNKPQTADQLIQAFVRKLKNPRNWTVVSSDNEIIFTARDHGVNVLKSENFVNQKTAASVKNKFSQKENPQNIDLDYWLNTFNSNKDDEK
jgi:hypothetical protein